MPIDPAIQSAQASQLAQLLKACTANQGSWGPEDIAAMVEAELEHPVAISSNQIDDLDNSGQPTLRKLLSQSPAPRILLRHVFEYYQACEQHPESGIANGVARELSRLIRCRLEESSE